MLCKTCLYKLVVNERRILMKNTKKIKSLINGVLLGIFLLATGTIAMASNFKSSENTVTNKIGITAQRHCPPGNGPMQGKMQEFLDSQVKSGVITQEKANELQGFFNKKAQARKAQCEKLRKMSPEERRSLREQIKKERPDFFADAVKEGILTQKQAETIKKAFWDNKIAERQKVIETKLNTLVEKGTITAEQKTAILDQIQQDHKKWQANREKMKNMTKEERKDSLKQLVQNGTITQEQADAVKKILSKQARHQGYKGKFNKNQEKPM